MAMFIKFTKSASDPFRVIMASIVLSAYKSFIAAPPTTTGMWDEDIIFLINLRAGLMFSFRVMETRIISGCRSFMYLIMESAGTEGKAL
jgi:hypothetical protein